MDIKENFANNICRYRKALNLTQAEFADKINYSDKAVSKWERAESLPDVITLKQIADFFNVTIDNLISEPKEEKPKLYKNLSKKRILVALAAAVIVWLVAICSYCFISNIFPKVSHNWMSFVYAVPVTLFVLRMLTWVWGKTLANLIISSLLSWTSILTIYLTLLFSLVSPPSTLWEIFLIGIPIQALLMFHFFYKRVK